MIDLLLFSLPTWAVVALVVLYVPACFVVACAIGRLLALNDQPIVERARADIAERSTERVIPADLMDHDGLGSY